jgi:hypothetical protein
MVVRLRGTPPRKHQAKTVQGYLARYLARRLRFRGTSPPASLTPSLFFLITYPEHGLVIELGYSRTMLRVQRWS